MCLGGVLFVLITSVWVGSVCVGGGGGTLFCPPCVQSCQQVHGIKTRSSLVKGSITCLFFLARQARERWCSLCGYITGTTPSLHLRRYCSLRVSKSSTCMHSECRAWHVHRASCCDLLPTCSPEVPLWPPVLPRSETTGMGKFCYLCAFFRQHAFS